MYPLTTNAPWPREQWYIAGFSSEIGGGLLDRTLLSERVVLFRDEEGAPHALSGICPHRMMPMALGSYADGRLTCGYHGLTFDLEGRCVETPTSTRAANCSLRRYPIREVAPLVWIWLGDEEAADATPLPPQDAAGIGSDGWLTQCVTYHKLGARYTLLIDNLFDLSHLAFIHASILGKSDLAFADAKVEEREGRLTVSRILRNAPTTDRERYRFPDVGPTMTNEMFSEAIAIGLISAGGPTFDGPDERSPRLGQQNFIHGFTPETPNTTHYWLLSTRDFRMSDDQFSSQMAASIQAVVAQDVEALEEIEKLLGSGVALPKEISMLSDAGALRARLRLTQMIRREEGAEAASDISGVSADTDAAAIQAPESLIRARR